MMGDMTDAELFEEHRGLLFSIAYRMVGSVAEAEDIVQDAFLRWSSGDRSDVDSPRAFLSSIVTRLALDHLGSARHQREAYVGPWLPEPLLIDDSGDAAQHLEMADSLSMAFLVMLEKLNPVERAVLLLRDVFDYPYGEVAEMVNKSEDNCRQILKRARAHLADSRSRFDASREERERLALSFVQATGSGDLDALVSILSDDVTLWSDGGGHVRAARKPIYGRLKVARFIAGVLRKERARLSVRFAWINGQPGFISYLDDEVDNVLLLDVGGGSISGIRIVRNPEKLQHLRPKDRPGT